MTHNGHGLAMWRYLKTSSPEPLLGKVTNVDFTNYSSALFVEPGLKMISELKAEKIFVQPPYSQTACCVQGYLILIVITLLLVLQVFNSVVCF